MGEANEDNRRQNKLIYPKLSYLIVGIAFDVHNEIGRFGREKQYCDLLEMKFKKQNLNFKRELNIGNTGNRLDFLINDKIILEIKAKDKIEKDDYFQLQRYLQRTGYLLGYLINFRCRYLSPKRIVKIETDVRKRFQ